MKKVKTTLCTSDCTELFTLWDRHFLKSEGDRRTPEKKAPVEKTPNRAGATPLFRLSAAQKVFGVAPALRHLNRCRYFFHRGQPSFGSRIQEEEHHVHHQESASHSHA